MTNPAQPTTQFVNQAEAARFFKALTGEANPEITFQTFKDKKDGESALAGIQHGTLTEHIAWLRAKSEAGAGVFFMVNQGDGNGRAAVNVEIARSQFVDLDESGLPKAWAIQPDIITQSSPGRFHAYWLIEPGTPLDKWRDNQARLAAFYGGDPSVIDPPRVLRVPGFVHQKADPYMVEIVYCQPAFPPHNAEVLALAHPCDYRKPGERNHYDSQSRREPVGGYDDDADIARARAYLATAPVSIEGDGGNNNAFRVAAQLNDLGISPEMAVTLMMEDAGWNDRCQPAWDENELETICGNAASYKGNAPGAKSTGAAAADFADAPIDDATVKAIAPHVLEGESIPPTKSLFETFTIGQLLALPNPKWLIRDLIIEGGLCEFYGAPKAGKTLWGIEAACCVSTGLEFFGSPVKGPQPTLYCIAEGSQKIFARRVDTWAVERAGGNADELIHLRGLLEKNLAVLPVALKVDMEEQVMAFLKVNPTPRALVTLDTLFRTMAGKVMDPTDFQRYVDGCDMIRRKLKTAVLFLHHQKRNDASGGFGSIVQEASVEMAAKVSGGDKPGSSILTVEWFRDGDSNQENWTCRIEAREIDDPDLADDDVRKVPVLVFEQRGEDKDRSILGAIKAHSPKTVDALLAKIQRDGKPSKPTLERALRRLREEGKVAIGSLELTAKGMGFGPDKDDDKA